MRILAQLYTLARNRGKVTVKNPARHSGIPGGIPGGIHTGKENDARDGDELWEKAYKVYPGRMDKLYKQFLSSTGHDTASNNYVDGRDLPKMADDPFSARSLQLALLMNSIAGSDFSKRLEKGQVSGFNMPAKNAKGESNAAKIAHSAFNDIFSFLEEGDSGLKLQVKDSNIAGTGDTLHAVEVSGTEVVDGVEKPFTEIPSAILCKNPDAAR